MLEHFRCDWTPSLSIYYGVWKLWIAQDGTIHTQCQSNTEETIHKTVLYQECTFDLNKRFAHTDKGEGTCKTLGDLTYISMNRMAEDDPESLRNGKQNLAKMCSFELGRSKKGKGKTYVRVNNLIDKKAEDLQRAVLAHRRDDGNKYYTHLKEGSVMFWIDQSQ